MNYKREIMEAFLLLFCIVIMFYSVFYLEGREYYFVSMAIILSGVMMFLLKFENRRPSVAELTVIAVLCAVAVVSRISFFFLPQIKPMAAIIIMAGISLGAETGFVTGAVSAFVSNFYFGQGSWTPFQMFALGVIGFFAGVIFRKLPLNRFTAALYGFFSVMILYGGINDINTLFYTAGEQNTWQAVLTVCAGSFSFNLMFAVSTAIFMMVLYRPVLNQLARMKRKYNS